MSTESEKDGSLSEAGVSEIGWRAYEHTSEAVVRVDNKAWIVLGLIGASALLVYNMSGIDKPLGRLVDGASLVLYEIAVAAGLISAVLALLVVFPQLRRRRVRDEASNFLYFGRLRRLRVDEILPYLGTASPIAPTEIVAQQIRTMADIAWLKNTLLQGSLACWFMGVVAILFAVWLR